VINIELVNSFRVVFQITKLDDGLAIGITRSFGDSTFCIISLEDAKSFSAEVREVITSSDFFLCDVSTKCKGLRFSSRHFCISEGNKLMYVKPSPTGLEVFLKSLESGIC
jgi:hypothetical protein